MPASLNGTTDRIEEIDGTWPTCAIPQALRHCEVEVVQQPEAAQHDIRHAHAHPEERKADRDFCAVDYARLVENDAGNGTFLQQQTNKRCADLKQRSTR